MSNHRPYTPLLPPAFSLWDDSLVDSPKTVPYYTAGKCHDHGFMAFDWQSTDTCHGVGQALHKSLCSFIVLPITNFAWAPGFKPHAKQIHCTAGVDADKGHKMYRLSHADKGTKGFVQCLANAMASVGALPIKCHEPTVMALACSVIRTYQTHSRRHFKWPTDSQEGPILGHHPRNPVSTAMLSPLLSGDMIHPRQETLCNTCDLYLQQRHCPRPHQLINMDIDDNETLQIPDTEYTGPKCSHCLMRQMSYGNTTEEMNLGVSSWRCSMHIALVTPTHPHEGYGGHPRKFSNVNAKEMKTDGHPQTGPRCVDLGRVSQQRGKQLHDHVGLEPPTASSSTVQPLARYNAEDRERDGRASSVWLFRALADEGA
ncbi:hypothetical protein B0H14DRAFT_2632187 [Mycena olivaceomarginata]|nr:hypothetical protein B0H14DRAFT_2632187 [Mycena olivaceomarginata]